MRPRVLDDVRQVEGIGLWHPQQVHGQALRRAATNAREARQLSNQRLSRRGQHGALEPRQRHASSQRTEPVLLRLLGNRLRIVEGSEHEVLQHLRIVRVD